MFKTYLRARHLSSIFCVLMLFSGTGSSESLDRKLCVFDPIGRNGDIYASALDLKNDYLSLGVNFSIEAFTGEGQVKRKYSKGDCDAMLITGLSSRPYNKFIYTVEALRQFENAQQVKSVFSAIASPRLASLMVEDGVELAGLFYAGFVYLFVNEERLANLENIENEKFFLLYGDEINPLVVNKLGVSPVYGNSTNFVSKFINGKTSMLIAPFAAAVPLGVMDSIDKSGGGFINLPVRILTMQLYIKASRFPGGFGAQSRMITLDYFDKAEEIVREYHYGTEKFIINNSDEEMQEWEGVLSEMSSELIKNNTYDSRMLKLIKKVVSESD